ncbi:hypothetical protein [Natrinema altunense]|nr:hypothetical protein [Natrinema altunense]
MGPASGRPSPDPSGATRRLTTPTATRETTIEPLEIEHDDE